MGEGQGLAYVLICLAIAIALFLIFRAIVLWYWRVNEGIALLRAIDEKLGRIAGVKPEALSASASASGRAEPYMG